MTGAQPNRLPAGGLIDRGRTFSFLFDGKSYQGHPGDTLASALLANGVRLVGRSFKYHRPRGIYAAGNEEPNALVELRGGARREPNTRATVVELFDGLQAQSQNRFPSLGFDLMALGDLAAPVIGAGFYYKTFMWPASFWEKVYEPLIRGAAGLGRLSMEADPDTYEKSFAHCDLLVIGAGPAGLAAALAAGRAGARVILADEDRRPGGRLLGETHEIDDRPGAGWAAAAAAELESLPEVRLMPRTTVHGRFDNGIYGAVERVADHLPTPPAHLPRQRLWRITAKHTVLAAGAIERPIVFPDNDRPGIMLAGAVRGFANRQAALAGRRTAVFTNNDDGWRTAADLARAGTEVAAVIDTRPDAARPKLLDGLDHVQVIPGGQVVGTQGRRGLRSVSVLDGAGRRRQIAADTLAVSGGWNPTIGLACHTGARPVWRDEIAAFVPGPDAPADITAVGAAAGAFTTAAALAQGFAAGERAASELGLSPARSSLATAEDGPVKVAPFWQVTAGKGRAWLDFQNDVTTKDVALAVREGFRTAEHLKRYTTLGMATDQGKTANVSALAVLAGLTDRTIEETGTTTFRPPHSPVAIGALAGRSRGRDFRPTRLAPSHDWAEEQGAVFVEAGLWLRAQWFPRPGETHWRQSVDREVMAVRTGVGLCDVSTLGKIDIQGRDAARFLDRVYANGFGGLAVGKCRYGLMLREDGIVMDDGTTARLSENHYLMTTTTANAAAVLRHLEFCRQCLWPDMDVALTPVTEQWAQYAVAGPQSRRLLRKIVDTAFDLSSQAFPFMACGAVTVCGGAPARLFRISFSGELAYEIAVPARYGDAMIRALMEAGTEFGATPYGTEALGVLRIEKGHPAGNELNGQTTARDLGLGRMVSKKKDCIGRIASERPGLNRADGLALVGVKPVDRAQGLAAGAHFITLGQPATGDHDEGYLTSVAHSPTLGHAIGLGFLKRGDERLGQRVRAVDLLRGRDIEVKVCALPFVDPEGARARA